MKQNLVVLLADLFNLFEIHPAKCVSYPGMDQHSSSKFSKKILFFSQLSFRGNFKLIFSIKRNVFVNIDGLFFVFDVALLKQLTL